MHSGHGITWHGVSTLYDRRPVNAPEGVVHFLGTFLVVEVGPDLVHFGRGGYARESLDTFYANDDA